MDIKEGSLYLLHNLVHANLTLKDLYSGGTLTVEIFQEKASRVVKALESIVDQKIEGVPDEELGECYINTLRRAYEILTKVESPPDIDKGMQTIYWLIEMFGHQ